MRLFKLLKAENSADIVALNNILKKIYLRFRNHNRQSEDSEDGVYNSPEDQYLSCFQIDYERYNALMHRDELLLQNEIDTAKETAQDLMKQYHEFMAQ